MSDIRFGFACASSGLRLRFVWARFRRPDADARRAPPERHDEEGRHPPS
jgi:hypothetical protein